MTIFYPLFIVIFQYKHAVYVQTCKLFADLERMRQEREAKDMHERYFYVLHR